MPDSKRSRKPKPRPRTTGGKRDTGVRKKSDARTPRGRSSTTGGSTPKPKRGGGSASRPGSKPKSTGAHRSVGSSSGTQVISIPKVGRKSGGSTSSVNLVKSKTRSGSSSSVRLRSPGKRDKPSSRKGKNKNKNKSSKGASSGSHEKVGTRSGSPGGGKKNRKAKFKIIFKFTIPVLLLISFIVAIFFLLIPQALERKLLNEIKKDGASNANALAREGRKMLRANKLAWENEDYRNGIYWPVQMGLISQAAFEKNMNTGMKADDNAGNKFINGLIKSRLLSKFISYQTGKPNEILDAYVIDNSKPGRPMIATAYPEKTVRILNQSTLPAFDNKTLMIGNQRLNLATDAGLKQVSRGSLKRNGKTYQLMQFHIQLTNPPGLVILALRADVIKEEIASLRQRMLLIGGLSIAGAFLLCFLIGSVITKPIKLLEKDMGIVARGDFEHRTRVHSNDEVGVLAAAFNDMTRQLLIARGAEKEAERLENELDMAREIQMKLLPPGIPKVKGFDIHAIYKPAKEVGGDYYDFLNIGTKDHMGIMVADVSGKGIPGSMVMATTRTVLRFVAARNTSAMDTLSQVNRIVAADIRRGMFVTAFYIVLDARTKTILCGSAGHNPMALHRASGELELINPNGIALGFDKGPIFSRTIKEQELQLHSGDRVVLYTDGVVEAMSPDSEEFSDERFYDFVRDNPSLNSKDFVDKLLRDLEKWKGRAEQHDDITIVTFRVQ